MLITSNTKAQQQFSLAKLDSVVQLIYNFQFDEARDLTGSIQTDASFRLLPLAYSRYWEFLSGNEPDKNLKACNRLLKNKIHTEAIDSLQRVYNVSVDLLQFRVHISRSNYIAPLLLIDDIRVFFIHEEPNYKDEFSLLYWGLYNYYVSYARNHTFAARYLLNDWPESSTQSGISMLNALRNSSSVFVRTEALYFLMRIYFEGEKNYCEALKIATELVTDYPNNYIYKWFLLRILKADGDESGLSDFKQKYSKELLKPEILTKQQQQHFKVLFSKL